MDKSFLQSKVFWSNLLLPVFLFLGAHYGLNLDADTQSTIITLIMAVINIGLRFITTQPVSVSLPK